ncbi:DNA methyltransferase [Candidatus Poriferisocius sp.]|uniref:DNA methyltransferase n=1 Tax=Candidatus Poriferisocius sp. TaxID=3101276 RepID=UPI003B5B7562
MAIVEPVSAGLTPEQFDAGYQIDTSFDMMGVSELARRERSAFKPVYSMNRWWARRSSAVFRAILLGLLDESGPATARVLYKNAQTQFPQVKQQVILDPFMGGGTTVVEGLRSGFRVIGTDLNPLSWFIVRNESTPIDIESLDAAFDRVRKRVADRIAELYITECPNCEHSAEIVHTFWAKVAACETCQDPVTLRRSRVIGRRRGEATVAFEPAKCSACGCRFDLEHDHVALTGPSGPRSWEPGEKRWATVGEQGNAACPDCGLPVAANLDAKPQFKRIEIFAVQCPCCTALSSRRGPLPEKVTCGICETRFEPELSNTSRGVFECPAGHTSSIAAAARSAPGPLPFTMYAIEGFCPHCEQEENPMASRLGYRFFKTPDVDDRERYHRAQRLWRRHRSNLPWPRGTIEDYEKTNRLVVHNYSRWCELFNDRQLLSLAWILAAIKEEPELSIREALTSAFLGTLEHQNMLNIYYLPYAQSAGAFGRHDFHPKVEACEGQPWGGTKGRGTFRLSYRTVREGKGYLADPFEPDYQSGRRIRVQTGDTASPEHVNTFDELLRAEGTVLLRSCDSRHLEFIPTGSVDHIVTDPPYADAVQYSELADFFYVWMREALGDDYSELLSPDETPKAWEIVENASRGHSQEDFHTGLQDVFTECNRVLKDNGRLVFTFHHSKRSQWEDLYRVINDAGFQLIAAHPVASEGTRSGNLVFHTNRKSVAYDIIHVCAKRRETAVPSPEVWRVARSFLAHSLLEQIDFLLDGSDHGQRVYPSDVAIMAWAEVLKLYSACSDRVLTPEGHSLPLADALDDIEPIIRDAASYALERTGSSTTAQYSATS